MTGACRLQTTHAQTLHRYDTSDTSKQQVASMRWPDSACEVLASGCDHFMKGLQAWQFPATQMPQLPTARMCAARVQLEALLASKHTTLCPRQETTQTWPICTDTCGSSKVLCAKLLLGPVELHRPL